MMKVLLTGPDGVLGNNLCRMLLERNYEVRAFIQEGKPEGLLADLPIEKQWGNLLNPQDLEKAVNGCQVVIHAAANTNTWPTRHSIYYKVNVEGTKNLVSACKLNNIQRFIHVGTANSFGAGKRANPGTEKNSFTAGQYKLDYITSKYKAHQYVLEEVKENGFPAVIVNPTFMIGPYDSKPSSGQMILAIQQGKVPGYTTGGRNFVYVKDVATAIINAIELGEIGESYLLGNENLNYQQAFQKMATTCNVKAPTFKFPKFLTLFYGGLMSFLASIFRFQPAVSYPLARISIDEHFYDCSKAVNELKMPQTPIEQALEEAVKWFKENGYISDNQR